MHAGGSFLKIVFAVIVAQILVGVARKQFPSLPF